MEILSCLNQNSGAITAIATVILVLITLWYAYITKRILVSNEKFANDQFRPYIVAHLYSEDHFLKFEIHNLGTRPAVSVNIEFTPSLFEIDRLVANKTTERHKPMLEQSFMPPNFKISTALMHTPKFVEQPDLPRYFTANIKYKDLSNKDYAESYKLDLAKYIYSEKTIEFTNNYYFAEINKQLKEINNSIKNRE